MKFMSKKFAAVITIVILILAMSVPAFAAESSDSIALVEAGVDIFTGDKAMGAAIAVGIAAAGGAVGMGIAIAKALESIGRQPEAEGKVRTTMMLGLVFIETAIIYALVVGILIIFVL